ncbi:Demethylmenaquinone methyltransferase [Novipirellula galeiformis]|uniref:Demethylmenaquinone methyltransferase n=1 Tax=Novipirellula galeiformis TaxID=2528004 RepID=A0A5C6CDK0_9BACT|nr:methyltransferase domain-containing protein [Novipirellula galeiformis]TWU22222.1 Demethylmenaquinone methyltransferase [Novipirellula galeiformis]
MKRFDILALSLLALLTSSPVRAQTATIEDTSTKKSAGVGTPGKAKPSVNPGINDSFLDPQLDVQAWVERFEVESREVYHARDAIMSQLNLKPGDRVADVGAGTGFYSLLMSDAVGPQGWVYAIDISPNFVQYLADQFDQREVENVTTVMCDDDSICLPPNSIDLAFICDVYHHFEFPQQSMKSIFKSLRRGGRVVMIDFERIPGVSREWTIGHVRAGKSTFIDEVQSVGFELTAERTIPGFKENYYLEFRKPDQAGDE